MLLLVVLAGCDISERVNSQEYVDSFPVVMCYDGIAFRMGYPQVPDSPPLRVGCLFLLIKITNIDNDIS